ncbi:MULTISPECIES: hypothetical protein [unclassified Pseudoclavibacter]|uniref:hypothetical protein n=1 Tax=unclassified Pseudoclavibacter TaxID=2615177 RepID=UPI001BA620AB|nr:hypothetical protein [Pseudoclavibacter sp. Marseille-Q4354]MBS3177724.1 hypothetical protein [Pseudoclavibacter sp. Marseille-Q4354]
MTFSEDSWGQLASIADDRSVSIADVVVVGAKTALSLVKPIERTSVFVVTELEAANIRNMLPTGCTDAEIAEWVHVELAVVAHLRAEVSGAVQS